MQINGREIGPGHPPYIVAEIGGNHGGKVERAFELIDAAAACGADAVKFQCFEADTITIDCDRPEFIIESGPWMGQKLFDLYRKTQTPFHWFPDLKERAANAGITWFASVFDKSSVDLMVTLGAPAIKIASFELVDLPLIQYAAKTHKPLIISTGMAAPEEAQAAAGAVIAGHGHASDMIFLDCVSAYPAPANEIGLRQMHGVAGISDHTIDPEVPIAATALGAAMIEKHFRLSFHPDTEDSAFSLDEIDFANMVRSVRLTWRAMQDSKVESEQPQRALRRSLFAVEDIAAGEVFSDANVRSIRPGHGLPPGEIARIRGRSAARAIARGEPLAWDMIR